MLHGEFNLTKKKNHHTQKSNKKVFESSWWNSVYRTGRREIAEDSGVKAFVDIPI